MFHNTPHPWECLNWYHRTPRVVKCLHDSRTVYHGYLARYVKLWVAHAPGMPRTFSPPPRVSDPDMHNDTCVTHVSWCMPGSLTRGFLWSRWRGNVPGVPGACATRNFEYLVRGPLHASKTSQCRWWIYVRFDISTMSYFRFLIKRF